MDMQFRSLVYGYMPVVAEAFIKPINAMTDRRASLERVGARSNPTQHACSICQAPKGTTCPSEPPFRLVEPVQGSMRDKVVLNPASSARYVPRLPESADLIDRAV